ncbi:TIGR02302 family protein [Arvimicrobium flavum]|uniref:TIGR02302 family protein n=1 Tax=Arvimicrobium flavum TaxID=3393320 RepID=UPI00237B0AB6|nr:TIGR02302 family protein [Mesorhizobium shangrilense]
MKEPTTASATNSRNGRLRWARLGTWTAIHVERLWPLLLPLLIVGGLFLAISWFGLFRLMPDVMRLAVLALFGIAVLGAVYPLRYFRRPSATEIDRRIESSNRLLHTPVTVQGDRLSGRETGFGEALWREHQRRMAARLRDLSGDLPRPRVPERDPWGLRAAVPLLLLAAFAFSFGPLGGRLDDGFRAHASVDSLPARIDAWVTPPAYTRKAPIFLTADAAQPGATFTVPEGSDVALRVTGGAGDETLAFVEANGVFHDIAPKVAAPDAAPPVVQSASASRQFAGKLTMDGTLVLKSGDAELRSWAFKIVPDSPPTITFVGEPKRAVNGTLELNYEIADDYGAASAEAEFKLIDPSASNARPLYEAPDLPLALPRRGAEAKAAKASRDLTEHAWAGLPVTLTLKAVDDAGQEATSETKRIILPARPFTNPLAKAVVEQRRMLALDANRKADVRGLMDAITLRPEDTFDNLSHYLGIMAGMTRLKLAQSDDQLREAADYLWQMALTIEDGDLSAAEKRLRQAQENLKQALENGASDEEIDQLMKELREAMDEFLREFAERAQQDPNLAEQLPQNGQQLRESDLQRMLDQIENLAKSGNRDQAQQLLSELQNLMNNLQAGRRQQQRQQDGQSGEMKKQMDRLGDIMRRQQQTMNETFGLGQQQRDRQQRGDPGEQGGEPQAGENGEGQPQDGPGMTPEEFAEALKQLQEGQGQLQKDLQGLMKDLEGLGVQPGEGFGDAGEAMGEAEGSLGEGEDERAVGEQGRALEALRRGAQDMMQQMMQAMQGDQGGSEQGGRQQNADRDPLGRPRATTGPDFGDSVKVPDEIDVQRARQILEAIRKRLGNALSPALERDYLERLLDMR